MNWKRWMLSCAVFGAVACSDSENDDADKPDVGISGSGEGGVDGGGGDIDGGARFDAGDNGGDGGGHGSGDDGGVACTDRTLRITIRDFKEEHPDFEVYSGTAATTGLLEDELVNSKPVFKAGMGQITSADTFAQWYQDVPGVNQTFQVPGTLTPSDTAGSFEFEERKFFPIDGLGWGDEGNAEGGNGPKHNYHFTTEIHTLFTYQRNQVFTFLGDDDLWIFVNNRLALDLGGLHEELSGTIDFDAQAEQLGIKPGQTYQMDIFHAERHTVESRFRIETNIECFTDVAI